MNPIEIITKKRNGIKLSFSELEYMVKGAADGSIPDYQLGAILMAVYFNGMDFEETAWFTELMLNSGEKFDFSSIPAPKIDKHSTGGVGDKVSLILAPLVASTGVYVPMISGRGLGHSGGTLDKLEAIPGFRTNLSGAEFTKTLKDVGCSLIGQTLQICPADKKLYALRDATATIESIPLITASILSKKLAEGIDGLVMDVKTGSGAFMTSIDDSMKLAQSILKTAQLNGLKTTVLITNMDQPLGNACGNWLETKESIECLNGNGPTDLMDVTIELAAHMYLLAKPDSSLESAKNLMNDQIETGAALAKFIEIVKTQGGNTEVIHNPEIYPPTKYEEQVFIDQPGYVTKLNAKDIGTAIVQLGGGRQHMDDQIDYGAGVVLHKKIGDTCSTDEPIATLYTNRLDFINEATQIIKNAYTIRDNQPLPYQLILETLTEDE